MNATLLFPDGLPFGPSRKESLPAAARGGLVRLHADQHLQLRGALGSSVQAVSGAVWLTQDGDLRDIVLEAGQRFVIDRPATTLLSALGDAAIRIEPPPCNGTLRRGTQPSAFFRMLFA